MNSLYTLVEASLCLTYISEDPYQLISTPKCLKKATMSVLSSQKRKGIIETFASLKVVSGSLVQFFYFNIKSTVSFLQNFFFKNEGSYRKSNFMMKGFLAVL